MKGKTIAELKVGDQASFTKSISEADVYGYAGITGDFNPAHVNEIYAQNTMFKTRIAHGLLSGGLISTVLGTHLPGPGTIYLSQEFNFKRPVQIGDTITARVEVMEIDTSGKFPIVTLKTECLNQTEQVVITGTAKVIPPQ